MMKAKATGHNDEPLYIFGLSHLNLDLLRAGKPISINLKEMGGTGKVMIFAGATEQAMMDELQKHDLLPAAAADATGAKN